MTTPEDLSHLSEEEAARLWQRAAQLQLEAAQRAEVATTRGDRGGRDGHEGHDDALETGYALEHVRTAAIEAGIGSEFLDVALTELRADREIAQPRRARVLSRRFLNDPPESLTVRRTIAASPREVLRAMEEVFPKDPYALSLNDRRGDPENGGLLIFDIQGAGFMSTEGFQGQVSSADLRQVLATVRPLDAEGTASELTLRAPIAWAHGINAGIGALMCGFVSTLGFAASSGLGSVVAGALLAGGAVAVPVAAAIAAGVTVAGTAGLSYGSVTGFRWLYDYSVGKGDQALGTLCSAVAVEAQGGWKLTDPTD